MRRDVHISPFRRSLGWLTVRCRRVYFLRIATFNILHDSSASYLGDLFIRSTPWLPQFVLLVTSPPMCLPSPIFVRLPAVIHFTWPPFIFSTLFLIPFAPRPPSGYSMIVFLGIYLTSISILLDVPSLSGSYCWSRSPWAFPRLAVLCCWWCASLIMFTAYYVYLILLFLWFT